jgi:hypothetical protein
MEKKKKIKELEKEPEKKSVKKVVKKVVKEPEKKVEKKVVKKVPKKEEPEKVKRKITVEYDTQKENTELDESKYAEKLKKILIKMKEQQVDTDNRIRFCWN